jgi:hypothetical protein
MAAAAAAAAATFAVATVAALRCRRQQRWRWSNQGAFLSNAVNAALVGIMASAMNMLIATTETAMLQILITQLLSRCERATKARETAGLRDESRRNLTPPMRSSGSPKGPPVLVAVWRRLLPRHRWQPRRGSRRRSPSRAAPRTPASWRQRPALSLPFPAVHGNTRRLAAAMRRRHLSSSTST